MMAALEEEDPASGNLRKMKEAKAALSSCIPPVESYSKAKSDLVAGLQQRDFKYATAISNLLIDELREFMLPTELVPLTFTDAETLYQNSLYRGTFKPTDSPELLQLIERVDLCFEKMKRTYPQSAGQFFVKLSFMSPKDVSLRTENPKTLRALKQGLDAIWNHTPFFSRFFLTARGGGDGSGGGGGGDNGSCSSTQISRCFYDSLYSSLQVESGFEAVSRICQSYRCFQELSDALIDKNYFHTNLIVRPWIRLKPGFEFRIFVSNRRITCASQYEGVYYEQVWARREALQQEIGDFIRNKILPRIQHRLPSVVVDVVLSEDEQYYVCELNPFATSSSSCMFSWSDDKQQIMIGEEQWRFAGPEAPLPQISEAWSSIIDEHFNNKKKQFYWKPLLVVFILLGGIALAWLFPSKLFGESR